MKTFEDKPSENEINIPDYIPYDVNFGTFDEYFKFEETNIAEQMEQLIGMIISYLSRNSGIYREVKPDINETDIDK